MKELRVKSAPYFWKNVNKLLPWQSIFSLSCSFSSKHKNITILFICIVNIKLFQWEWIFSLLWSYLLTTGNLKGLSGNFVISDFPSVCGPHQQQLYRPSVKPVQSNIFFLPKWHFRYICSLAPQLKWSQASLFQKGSLLLNSSVYLFNRISHRSSSQVDLQNLLVFWSIEVL